MFLGNPSIRAGVAAALTIAWGALLMWELNRYPFPHIFPYDINSPVLALELSHGASDIDAVLHRPEPNNAPLAKHIMWVVNVLDLVFIPIYGFFLWSLARVFTARIRVLTWLVVGTALFDYLEDWQIFKALERRQPANLFLLARQMGIIRIGAPVDRGSTASIGEHRVFIAHQEIDRHGLHLIGRPHRGRRRAGPMDWIFLYRDRAGNLRLPGDSQCYRAARPSLLDRRHFTEVRRELLRGAKEDREGVAYRGKTGAPHVMASYPPCLKNCTARSCFSAASRVENVPRFLRCPDFASFFRE